MYPVEVEPICLNPILSLIFSMPEARIRAMTLRMESPDFLKSEDRMSHASLTEVYSCVSDLVRLYC